MGGAGSTQTTLTGLVARWRACLASGEPLEFEARVRRADGEYHWMLHHKVALRDESGQMSNGMDRVIDIEERKRAEFRIRDLRQILDPRATAPRRHNSKPLSRDPGVHLVRCAVRRDHVCQ